MARQGARRFNDNTCKPGRCPATYGNFRVRVGWVERSETQRGGPSELLVENGLLPAGTDTVPFAIKAERSELAPVACLARMERLPSLASRATVDLSPPKRRARRRKRNPGRPAVLFALRGERRSAIQILDRAAQAEFGYFDR